MSTTECKVTMKYNHHNDITVSCSRSQAHATQAFIVAAVMGILGFLLFASSVYILLQPNLNIKWAMLPAAGGVVCGLLAAIALLVYKETLKQLNRDRKVLYEFERFWTCYSLLYNSKESKDQDILRELIRSEIAINLSDHRKTSSDEA